MRASLKRWLRVNPVTLTVGVIVLVALLFRAQTPLLDLIELKTYDLRVASRHPSAPLPAVALAVIDEKSLEREGRWPWPRSRIAALVDALSRDGAKVIGFDIAFVEPDENAQLALIDGFARELQARKLANAQVAGLLGEARRSADTDLALANALAASRSAIVLGYFFQEHATDLGYQLAPAEIARRPEALSASRYPFVHYRTPDSNIRTVIAAYAPEVNLDALMKATASSSGYFSMRNDRDGVLRWMPMAIRFGDDLFPPLSILCAWHYLGKPPMTVKAGPQGMEGIQLGERLIPIDESGRLLINYLGRPKTFPHFSATDILRGAVPAGAFKDRIVLIGATAVGTYDLKSTPVDSVYPGIEVHATVIDNILRSDFLQRPLWSEIYDLLAIAALPTLIGLALPRIGVVRGLAFSAALGAAYVAAGYWMFAQARVWLNLVYPLLALSLTYVALGTHYYVTEQRERRKIKETFKHYLTPDVMEEMLKEPDRLQLGGEEKLLTVLFCDLEGFTEFAEQSKPQELIGILSEYYDRMTEQVFAQQGTLVQYTGDELFALFGAPVDQSDHARRACAAALAMRDRRHALGDEWAATGRPRLKARTGINTGPMLVGNMGSSYRFSYSVLGDQVNLGSRLEGLNKAYGTEILVGERTAQLAHDTFRLREVDLVRVKGKRESVRIYELLAAAGALLPEAQEEALKIYAEGLQAYRAQRWEDALMLFMRCLSRWPADGPAQTMALRCHAYMAQAPAADWDGVFDQRSKG
jgi:adenylate cyclase